MNRMRYFWGALWSRLRVVRYRLTTTSPRLVRDFQAESSPLYADIRQWQKEQLSSMTFEKDAPAPSREGSIDLARMRRIHRRTLLQVAHSPGDLWRPSSVTLNEGRGISLDQSIAIMHRLRDAGFPDQSLGVISMEFNGRRHSFAIVHDCEDDFLILDNGLFVCIPVRGSVFFGAHPYVRILAGFNFFDIWLYAQ